MAIKHFVTRIITTLKVIQMIVCDGLTVSTKYVMNKLQNQQNIKICDVRKEMHR